MSNENKWVRLTSESGKLHLNASAPATPERGMTVCGQATTTPQYENEIRSYGRQGFPDQCIYCLFPEAGKKSGE